MFRPARREDILEFLPNVPCSAKAIAAEQDGVVYGVGGVYYSGRHVFAFSQFKPGMPKRAIVEGAKRIIDIVRTIKAPVWAVRGDFDSADRTLRHFGFSPVDDTEFYLWRAV